MILTALPPAPPALVEPAPLFPQRSALGAIWATCPGAIALDLRVLHFSDTGIGLDLELNSDQIGLGISAGSMLFLEAGVWRHWSDSGSGLLFGLGARF